MALASGHTVQEMDPQEKQKFLQDFKGSLNSDMIILQPGGWLVSRKLWLKFQERIYNFKVSLYAAILLILVSSSLLQQQLKQNFNIKIYHAKQTKFQSKTEQCKRNKIST